MDFNKILRRAQALLVSPRTEWPVIAIEPATVASLFREYILVLAAIPPICRFIKTCLLGYAWHGFTLYRLGTGQGLTAAIVEYAVTLGSVYLLAVIIESLAPNFEAQPNRVQAVKAAGYSYTAVWIAGIAQLLPSLYSLVALAGAIYSIFLLYLGLQSTMKVLPERAVGYTAAAVVTAVLLGWVLAVITGGITGVSLADS